MDAFWHISYSPCFLRSRSASIGGKQGMHLKPCMQFGMEARRSDPCPY